MFILVATASAQPPICSNLTITPAEIELGDNVTISFDIENQGSSSLTHMVNIRIENVNYPPPTWPPYNLTLIPVELGAYESKTVSHTITPDTIGDYKVTVNTIKGTFTVKHPEIPPLPLPPFLSNLTITPAEIERGDNVTISFDIRNTDSQSITYMVDMQITFPIDVELTFPIDVELEAYESKTMSRTMFPTAVGIYNVTVIGMTGSFTVKAPPLPAEFVVSGLTITREPLDVLSWTFEIAANVTNVGEQEGTHTVAFKLDGLEVDWRTVELGGGETTIIVYNVMSGVGSFPFEVNGLTGILEIESIPGPKFEFSNLRIFYPGVIPPEVERDETVTVTVSIEAENVGELEGGHTVELKVDGEVIDSKEVTLEGGASATVLFELTRGEGTHEVEVEGFTESFTVNPKPSFWDKIPGFPYESIILGLMIGAFMLWLLSRRTMTLI